MCGTFPRTLKIVKFLSCALVPVEGKAFPLDFLLRYETATTSNMKLLLSIAFLSHVTGGNFPIFDYRTRMRVLLIPSDLRPGSVIYRLRGTDPEFNYPLKFSVADDVGRSVIRIENMPCNPTHTYCQANVFLTRKLEPDRVYDLILSLKNTVGRETKVDSTIKATKASTHFEDIFPYVPNVIMVPETTNIGTVLDFVLAKKNPINSHHSYLELWGSEKFRIVQNLSTKDLTNGSIVLTGNLDFEEKTMYTLQVFCLDPFTIAGEDTRNIAGFQLPVIVEDDQDMPPEFSSLPPVTKINNSLQVGGKILKVQAQDGDRGNPRPIRYSLMTEDSPFSSYFNISEKTGDILLAKPLKELASVMKSNQPVILTVLAEEVKKNILEPPAMTATAQVAFLIENDVANTPPYFENEELSTRLAENSPQGTTLVFSEPYSTMVKDEDLGKDGVFALSLENNNGTFEILPSVGERRANFVIRVRNNELLDYEERSYVIFTIIAKEVTPQADITGSLSSRANVTVYLDDQNDNSPVFFQGRYEAEIPENVTAGTVVTQVQASDVDTGLYGRVFYTNILGNINQSLAIDSTTGLITVATNNHGFDRESAQQYKLMVEARDMEGTGNRATVPLIIKLLDVNDETPEFERSTFEFILQPNLRNFTSRAFVKAVDRDAEKPNNIVRYEIMSGNYENKFVLNEITGELSIRGRLSNSNIRQSDNQDEFYNLGSDRRESEFHDEVISVFVLTVRAYDLGVPHRWQHTYVRIYPPESRARNMNFIVAGSNPDKRRIEDLLAQLTGGRVSIQDIRPYTGQETGTDLSWKDGSKGEKSVVSATVFYDGNSYVDLNQVEKRLTQNRTQAIVEASVTEYKNENRVLFWLLILFLILMLLVLLTLILCCIWQGCCICPWFEFDRKRIVSPTENIKFIAHERNRRDIKAVSYYGRKEAWSGHDNERAYHHERRPSREKLVRQMKIDNSDEYGAAGATFRSHSNEENGGPNVIYTRDFIRAEKERNPTMVVEDVEINPYTMKGSKTHADDYHPSFRLNINSDREPDSDSIRRHEVERGSDSDKKKSDESPEKRRIPTGHPRGNQKVIKEYRLVLERPEDNPSDEDAMDFDHEESNRDQYYIRDGNAEILRLVTRGNQEERPKPSEQDFIKLEKGKDIIMKKFMEDQRQTSGNNNNNNNFQDGFQQELLRALQKQFEDRNSDASFQNRSIISESFPPPPPRIRAGAPIEINEPDPRFLGYSFQNQETQSLPGQIEMSTQTEREFGTQTEELYNLRPPRRRVRSDNEFSDEEEDSKEDKKFSSENAVEALNLGKGWIRREPKSFRTKKVKRYKMRTPILEEGEMENGIKYDTRPAMFKMPEYELIINGSGPGAYTENKSSILRRRKMKERILEDGRRGGNDELSSEEESTHMRTPNKTRRSRKDLLEKDKKERIALGKIHRTESLNRLYEAVQELGEQDLHKIAIDTKQRAVSLNRFYNALTNLEEDSRKSLKKSISLDSLKTQKDKEDRKDGETVQSSSTESQNPGEQPQGNSDAEGKSHKTKPGSPTPSPEAVRNQVLGSSQSVDDSEKYSKNKKSKYMEWYDDLSKKKPKRRVKQTTTTTTTMMVTKKKKEDDLDSGIAMSSLLGSKANEGDKSQSKTKTQQLLEKKSVFTIAYDGVKIKTIRPDTKSSEKC